jgi:hypothetical protein
LVIRLVMTLGQNSKRQDIARRPDPAMLKNSCAADKLLSEGETSANS